MTERLTDEEWAEGRRLKALAAADPDGLTSPNHIWTHDENFRFWLGDHGAALLDAADDVARVGSGQRVAEGRRLWEAYRSENYTSLAVIEWADWQRANIVSLFDDVARLEDELALQTDTVQALTAEVATLRAVMELLREEVRHSASCPVYGFEGVCRCGYDAAVAAYDDLFHAASTPDTARETCGNCGHPSPGHYGSCWYELDGPGAGPKPQKET